METPSVEEKAEGGARAQQPQQRGVNAVSPGRVLGGRNASPAKRRATDMEGDANGENSGPAERFSAVPGGFVWEQEEEGDFHDDPDEDDDDDDMTMSEMTATTTAVGSIATTPTTTSATSLEPELPPAYSRKEDNATVADETEPYTTEQINAQVDRVRQIQERELRRELGEGDRGVCISTKWLARVLSRTSEGMNSKDFPKEAREGVVGPLDNSDIVPDGAFDDPVLHDANGKPFIPLRPSVVMGEDFEVLPLEVYEAIVADYGYLRPQKYPILRYARNTAEHDAASTNIQYDFWPPIITVCKVPQPGAEPKDSIKPKDTVSALRAKQEAKKYGQRSPHDAVRLVTHRNEKFQSFLRRAKEAVGIPLTTRAKVWRLLDPTHVAVDHPDNTQAGVLSPPASRDTSPDKMGRVKLVISPQTFQKMEIGKDLEPVVLKDETHNAKYNGQSNMYTAGFFEDKSMLLEEQIGGPAGGEFQSNTLKGIGNVASIKKSSVSAPGSTATSRGTSPAPGGMMTRGRARKDGRTRGTVGLTNLGNTCYMNSALQCIRSVEELAVFFLSKRYKKEINNDNPLGYHGAMANAYAGVLRGIYESSGGSAFSPGDFKRVFGKAFPSFSGYGQQDSQEFLSFLVDALHEDVNRIKKKPYIENPDSDDSRVHDPQYILELGETYRNNHKQRNDSIAMDLFSGFYKNTMECPDCDKVSVTFDPYSLLTVQLPGEAIFEHNFTYIPLRGKPVIHQVEIDKNASIRTLKDFLAKKHSGAESSRLWMVEVYSHKVYRVIDDSSSVAEVNIASGDHIFVYELERVPKNVVRKSYTLSDSRNQVPFEGMASEQAESFAIPIFHRQKSRSNSTNRDISMHPLYIALTRAEAKDYESILKKVLIAVANMTSRPILKEFDEDATQSRLLPENDEPDKEQNGNEDTAGVSDHSAPSEDGYVKVSIDKPLQDTEMVNGVDDRGASASEETYVPDNFMDPEHFLSPALRNQLFELKYALSDNSNQHCASLGSIKESSIRIMHDRVKKTSRRSSVQSSASEESSTNTASGVDEIDNDTDAGGINDEPDMVLGDETFSAAVDDSGSDELASEKHLMEPSPIDWGRGGRGKRNKKNRRGKVGKGGNRHGVNTISTKSQRSMQPRGNEGALHGGKHVQDEQDGEYYIQLGEGIVLDWHPEAIDSLFNGDYADEDDLRGHRYVDDNGKSFRGGEDRTFPDPEQDTKREKRKQRSKNGVSLDECFAATSRPEVLSEDNQWYCNRCKEQKCATKTLEIWTIPDILVVHLKRFGGNRSFRDKVDLKIDYPIAGLDMSDKVGLKREGEECTYDLFAIDNHYGGLGGGHYTATAKNFHDGEWYEYNDSSCSKTSENRLHSAAAYMLFYRRRSEKPLGPAYLQDLVSEYRNPPASAEYAEDEESGEGRLGGPIFSGSGSSGILAGAAAAGKSQTGFVVSGGAGVDNPLTQRTSEYGNQGTHWSFAGLSTGDQAANLLGNVDAEDNDSTTAQDDRDSAIGSSRHEDATMDSEDNGSLASGAPNSPSEQRFVYYPDAPDTMAHFEDGVDGVDGVDPPAVEIRVSDVVSEDDAAAAAAAAAATAAAAVWD